MHFLFLALALAAPPAVPVYSVHEISFTGPSAGPPDSPARDVEFWVRIAHEKGASHRVHGFWDGGNVYKVRFCPTLPGRWTLAEVRSNRRELQNQRRGESINATFSTHPGFWIAGPRWYARSNGSHQYIFGNTIYSLLNEMSWDGKPNGSSIARDVRGNAQYFKKLRFSAIGDLYPHPVAAPFLDEAGKRTYDGDFSYRPNPAWFSERLDLAVRAAAELDHIADLIMAGVDLPTTRSALKNDPAPFLRYLAARYGAYPNVWFCLINEFDIKDPRYTTDDVKRWGALLKSFLAYPNPVSVHRSGGPWRAELNTSPSWNDHVIIQHKIRDLSEAAGRVHEGFLAGGANKPVIDDELSYEGAGDQHAEADTIESHLGPFWAAAMALPDTRPAVRADSGANRAPPW
jgi:hypothetical protein